MTAKRLIKELQKVVDKHGNVKVVANVDDLRTRLGNLAGDCSCADVTAVGYEVIYVADDDGGVAVNKDGTERTTRVVVLG